MKGEAICFQYYAKVHFFFEYPGVWKISVTSDHIAVIAVSKIPGNQFEFELALYGISIL